MQDQNIEEVFGVLPIFLTPDDPCSSLVGGNEEVGWLEFVSSLCRFLLFLRPWWFLPPCFKGGLGALPWISASAPVRGRDDFTTSKVPISKLTFPQKKCLIGTSQISPQVVQSIWLFRMCLFRKKCKYKYVWQFKKRRKWWDLIRSFLEINCQ